MPDDDLIRECSDLDVEQMFAAIYPTPTEKALELVSGVLWRGIDGLTVLAQDVDGLRRCMQRRRAARQLGARQ